ncbi:MAG: hypothetical protein H6719_28330 [Sandaracinaceae bacterium]|nr:hypothetical protein [Sandaracinaceae bacterium]
MAVTDHQRVEWSDALRSNLEPLTSLHGIVQDRVERQKAIGNALAKALELVERERSEAAGALSQLSEASEDAVRRARLVGVKLEMAFLEGDITEDAYRATLAAAFPAGSQSVGATPALRYDALKRIVSALVQFPGADPGGKLGELAHAGAKAIEDANLAAKREQEETQAAQEALSNARVEFDRAYQATKEIMSGLLRDAGRLDELRDIFPDM